MTRRARRKERQEQMRNPTPQKTIVTSDQGDTNYSNPNYWYFKHYSWCRYYESHGIEYAVHLLKQYFTDAPMTLRKQFKERYMFQQQVCKQGNHWTIWRRLWPRAEQLMREEHLLEYFTNWIQDQAKRHDVLIVKHIEDLGIPVMAKPLIQIIQLAFRDTLRLDDMQVRSPLIQISTYYQLQSYLLAAVTWCKSMNVATLHTCTIAYVSCSLNT